MIELKPKIGDKLYICSSYYIDHGEDDVEGGLATIDDIQLNFNPTCRDYNRVMVGMKEIPGVSYNYRYLLENQEEWAVEYAGKIAHPSPDYGDIT